MPPIDDAQGVKNLDSALSGDVSLHGASKEQIAALGGEIDEELDSFTADAKARGDILEEDTVEDEPKDEKDEKDEEAPDADEEADEDADEKEGDADEADEDAEDEADSDGDQDDPDADDAAKAKSKANEQRIPKSRFDEVNARRKAAEDELAQLKAQQEAAKASKENTFDFDKAEVEYMDLLLAGKTKDALAKRKEINAAQEQVWSQKTTENAVNNVTVERIQADLDSAVAKYEGLYDEFNPESESYSEDLVEEVDTFFSGYIAKRTDLTPQQAFDLAVQTTVRLYGLREKGASESPPQSDKGEGKTVVKKGVKKDVKKKIALAKEAPKDTSKAGDAGDAAGDTKFDINNMTDEELDALPEATLRRLRGDTL